MNSKVCVVQVIYNNKKWIEPVFNAIYSQTYKDFFVVAVIAGNQDGSKEFLQEKFPQVEIIDPNYNIGFAKGHNLVFEKYSNVDFFQLVNPDMIMGPDYIKQMLKVFEDEKVGAVTGKLYQFRDLRLKVEDLKKNKTLDTTGVVVYKSGRARDRGQHELDSGQYDLLTEVDAVSAAGVMYRASVLKQTSYEFENRIECFDEDFHSYWEDVDLAWRIKNAGYKNIFAPRAIGYHGRTAGSSKDGYFNILNFIKHHRTLSPRIRELNYRNHIFMYIKNSKIFYPQFFIREFFMFFFILFFETSTLKILPQIFHLLPKIIEKRKILQNA